ncbi:MAG TPA: glycosyltransferase [Bryobacteraceae bacterium]
MRVLLTNNTLSVRAGSELYVRDVAIELMRRGHHPVAYSTILGPVADELRAATVPVIQTLEALGEPPDIIHGQHHYDALAAMMWFPETPAIYYCHGWIPPEEAPLRFPRILRYVAVDELCRERLIAEGGIPPDRIELILNFFDERRFLPRPPLPVAPRVALAFANAFDENALRPLREACERCGVELHSRGISAGGAEPDPGDLLPRYDLVFAKARAAIEAMAVGTAVVLCNPGRLGTMVTSENFASLRMLNFGVRTLSRPLTAKLVVEELQRYDASDAAQVSALVRANCGLQPAMDRIVGLYERVLVEARRCPPHVSIESDRAVARYLEDSTPLYKQSALTHDRDVWRQRYLNAQKSLQEKESALSNAQEQKALLMERRTAAENARQEQASRLNALSEAQAEIQEDRSRWMDRCSAAERAQQEQTSRLWVLEREGRLGMDRLQDAQNRLAEKNTKVAALEHEIESLRNSASWRLTQRALQFWPVRVLFGRWIRAIARRLQRKAI